MNQPNILILHLDQLRQDCLGCYGNPDVHTPNIDALAQDSVTYQNHYTVYPICTPSRYSFFSSLYVHQHGAWDNHSTLPNGYPTFPKQLQKSGYYTSAVGKMHMTPTYQNIGFSEMQLAEQNGIGRFEDDYHRFLMEHGKIDRFDLHHQSDLFRQSPTSHLYDMCQCSESDLDLEFYSSEWITQNALSQIDAWDPKQPELLMIGYINPHHPFDPPAPYSTMYNPDTLHLLPGYLDQPIPFDTQANGTPVDYSTITESEMRSIMAAYYGMITEIDDGIGSIIQKLKEKGLYDNTIIVFTSDHGEYLGYHHMILKCNHLYDPLAKIPLLIKYPQQQFCGNIDPSLSENIDVAVTILDACNQPVPASMQGISLLRKKRRNYVFSEGQYGTEQSPNIGYMFRSDSYKLLVRGSFKNAVLYDLKKDPYEQHNVAHLSEYQEILKEFQAALSDFVLFHSLGKVHCDPSAPQLRDQEVLNRQADELKAFIRSQW